MKPAVDTPYKIYGLDLVRKCDDKELDPFLSDNRPVATLTLFKELTAYPNYGNPSGNADILYTGNRGRWTFRIPGFFFSPNSLRGKLRIRAVLDDRAATPKSKYSATISINDKVAHRGKLDDLENGRPFGQRFKNWETLEFDVPDVDRLNEVVIKNTSNGLEDDWIGLDWMELVLFRNDDDDCDDHDKDNC
ncbi:hypothetical protein V6C27_09985 [Peptococcaceae bacterium 1198_IL3148]